jgi:peptidoglycan-N-acetylglucosamine deacetylase
VVATSLQPPYGSVNAAVDQEAGVLGMKIVLWDVDTLDWKYRNVGSILRYLKAEVKPGSIILMHDGGGNRSQTVAALPAVIAWLRSQGYSLVSVNRLVQAQSAGGSQL